MSLPFVRSTRALHTDRERPALIILVISLLLLVLWAAWFFWASITLYETGQLVSTTRRGTVVAAFSTQAAARIQPGQFALLRPQGEQGQSARSEAVEDIPAMVMDVHTKVVNDQIQVELAPLSGEQLGGTRAQALKGQVVVEAEHVSPALLVWRASGQLIDSPTVLLNPQTQ